MRIVTILLGSLLHWLNQVLAHWSQQTAVWERQITHREPAVLPLPPGFDEEPSDEPPAAWRKLVEEAIPDEPPAAWLEIVERYRTNDTEHNVFSFHATDSPANPSPQQKQIRFNRRESTRRQGAAHRESTHTGHRSTSSGSHRAGYSVRGEFNTLLHRLFPRRTSGVTLHKTAEQHESHEAARQADPVITTAQPMHTKVSSDAPPEPAQYKRTPSLNASPSGLTFHETRKIRVENNPSPFERKGMSQRDMNTQTFTERRFVLRPTPTPSASAVHEAPASADAGDGMHPSNKAVSDTAESAQTLPAHLWPSLPKHMPPAAPPQAKADQETVGQHASRQRTASTSDRGPDVGTADAATAQTDALPHLPTMREAAAQTRRTAVPQSEAKSPARTGGEAQSPFHPTAALINQDDPSNPYASEPFSIATSLFPSLPDDFTRADDSVPPKTHQRLERESRQVLEREQRDRRR